MILKRFNTTFSDIYVNSPATGVAISGISYSDEPVYVFTNNTSAATTAALAVSNNVYFSIYVKPFSNGQLTVTNISFKAARGGASTARGYVLRSSLDNFASDIATADLATQRPTFTDVSIDLGSDFIGLDDGVEFRIYCYTPSSGQSVDFDDITITGESTIISTNNGISSYKELVESVEAGKECTYYWRKAPSVTVTQGIWFDMSMSPGMPVPQYYAATPMQATPMSFSGDKGIVHGYAPTKYLKSITTLGTQANPYPMNMILCDYLMFYPFIDEGTTDPQVLDNTNSLTRYTDGEGVRIMLVTQGARAGSPYVTVSYTNQDGVSGRTTVSHRMNNEIFNGGIATSNRAVADSGNPFLALQQGDTGVRSVESVTLATADVGLFAIVLVKPIAQTQILAVSAPYEKDFLVGNNQVPEIKNDAYLNWVVCPNGIFNASVTQGDLKVIWN